MITLWDGYTITADEYNVILGKPSITINKEGEEQERINKATYHRSLPEALRAFYRLQVRESIKDGEQTLSQALRKATEIEERIKAIATEPEFI